VEINLPLLYTITCISVRISLSTHGETMDKKAKLNTAIERVLHKHQNRVKEGIHDFTILFLRKNNIAVDQDSLVTIQDVHRRAFDAQHMEKLDLLLKELDEALNEFVE